MHKLKVSVIVPVYNVEKYLGKCLDSLVKQTLQDIEIIVVNDGSPDNSQVIIEEYANKYPEKIRAFVKPNGGVSDARNFGVKKAKGEYLTFVDSDDYVRNDMYELMYEKAMEERSDLVACNYYRIEKNEIEPYITLPSSLNYGKSVEEYPKILLQGQPYVWNKIYRRDWYLDNQFEFPVGQWFEDSAIIYNILYMANRVSMVHECLYFYQVDRQGSITNSVSLRMFDVFKSCESMRGFFLEHTSNKDVLEVLDRLCQIHLLTRMNDLRVSGSLRMKYSFYTAMIRYYRQHMPEWSENPYYQAVPKDNIYMKIRHIPTLMYLYMLIPSKWIAKDIEKRRKEKNYYMSLERIKELQKIELEILKEIDRICKSENIIYYLANTTLLGAMRHQAFVPWEAELDIWMPKKEYERFLGIVSEQLQDKYYCMKSDPSFIKIVSMEKYGFVNTSDKSGPFAKISAVDFHTEQKFIPFEDGMFPVPSNAHERLSSMYGNYMIIPPVQKQLWKHHFYDETSIVYQKKTKAIEEAEKKKKVLEEVKRLQSYGLEILKEVDRVCKENGIRYYLGENTLLGAVRHHGFIPWDTEVDVVMPREDFEQFMNVCDDKLGSKYKLQFYHNEEKYWQKAPKLRLLNNTEFAQSRFAKYLKELGPYINIYPLDYADELAGEAVKQAKKIRFYNKMLRLKIGLSTPKRKMSHLMKLYSRFFTVKQIHEKLQDTAKKRNDGLRTHYCNFGSSNDIQKEMFWVEKFGEPEYIRFEDALFPVPSDYDYVLKTTYGDDYMKLPPEKKRIAKHKFY